MKRFAVLAIIVVLGLVGAGIANAGGRPLTATLSGANEVPPADPDGFGFAEVTLNQGQGEVCFHITAENIDLPIVADHIHRGAAGVNGPVVVNFNAQFDGCTTGVDPELIKEIRQNPENFYVNLHNAPFPGGVIRGQLSK
jgi:hypothetical protein